MNITEGFGGRKKGKLERGGGEGREEERKGE